MEPQVKRLKTWHAVPMSEMARNTFNPIRSIVDGMKITPNPKKPMIALSIGDPTVFGNLPIPEEIDEAVIDKIRSHKYNGYNPSIGYEEARQAVADYTSSHDAPVTSKDVILTNGCSSALDLCITVLASRGQNILIPRPGFSIYKTLGESLGIQVRFYDLLPEKSWEVDLKHMESQMDENTAAVIVNSPSNPCGSVYSRQHIEEILEVLERNRIPMIADDIYEHFVFSENKYHSMASVSKTVPILSCSGLTKRGEFKHFSQKLFLVPGWRMGWIVVHDRSNAFHEIRIGLNSLSQRILGPNSLVQSALNDILKNTPQSFYAETLEYIEDNAKLFYKLISEIPGLKPVKPQGAMYMMVGIDTENFTNIKDDVDFTEKLVSEQSVFCLPAKCFQYPNFFRIVLTIPKEKVETACERIKEFCDLHYNGDSRSYISC
ncbi:TAT [Mytilus coruscus]|uniref:Tyrosine aminotransferase n=1 Tax=Mytilus coruscus TaxID=42192 RepID=A0A6J8AX61_MYTCO|nr:TAT [Mytilus coruscus]